MAALVRDLKQRGLLEDARVGWATEFGQTPMAQDKARSPIEMRRPRRRRSLAG